MTNNIKIDIGSYLNAQSRNKIVFHSEILDGIKSVDIGKNLASAIEFVIVDNKFSMNVSKLLEQLLTSSIVTHEIFGKVLAITNLGILLEPELKLDIIKLFENYSNTNVLFIHWEGEILEESIYFLTKNNGVKINIKT